MGALCGNYPTITGWTATLEDVRVDGTLWETALSVGFSPEGQPRETDEDLREYLENRGQYGVDRTEEIAALDA